MAESYRRLNLFMAKPVSADQVFADLLADALVDTYTFAIARRRSFLICCKSRLRSA